MHHSVMERVLGTLVAYAGVDVGDAFCGVLIPAHGYFSFSMVDPMAALF